ncbi:hypothetical protein D3C87_1884830 [compost metagenome]
MLERIAERGRTITPSDTLALIARIRYLEQQSALPDGWLEDVFIPTKPEAMIDFIGSHFDSMEADEWTEEGKPTGDLSRVRYSLTVHDLLSAFDWAGLIMLAHTSDAAAAPATQHTETK